MRYRTKVDVWIVVLLAGAVAVPITIAVVSYVRMGAGPAFWLPLAIAAMVVVLSFIVAVPTHYDVTPDRLVIRSGLLRWEVPLAEIASISPTSNPLSSPAWSLKRLEVDWLRHGSARSILISPQHSEEFLSEVANKDGALSSLTVNCSAPNNRRLATERGRDFSQSGTG